MKIFRFRPKNGLNFGDELGPYIVKHILNHLNLKSYPTNCDINFFSIGSVIHFSNHADIVWGSGINGKVSLPINQISKNIDIKEFKLIDARSKQRFEGKAPEPRKDVRGGSIPNSFCLPFGEIINENHTFKDTKKIINKFNSVLNSEISDNVVFSCGSGVTATVLALAYSLINNKYVPKIYDGSWAEYGKIK